MVSSIYTVKMPRDTINKTSYSKKGKIVPSRQHFLGRIVLFPLSRPELLSSFLFSKYLLSPFSFYWKTDIFSYIKSLKGLMLLLLPQVPPYIPSHPDQAPFCLSWEDKQFLRNNNKMKRKLIRRNMEKTKGKDSKEHKWNRFRTIPTRRWTPWISHTQKKPSKLEGSISTPKTFFSTPLPEGALSPEGRYKIETSHSKISQSA